MWSSNKSRQHKLVHVGSDSEPSTATIIPQNYSPLMNYFWAIFYSYVDVFEAMFNHSDVIENKNSQVTLKEDQPEAMAKLLEFIYTDRLKEESDYG